jgi:CDI toxin RNase A-like protein
VLLIDRAHVSLPPVGRGRPAAWLAGLVALLCQLGCQAAAPAHADSAPAPAGEARQAPAAAAPTQAAADRYDLAQDEGRGGHTLARHVGRSDADLKERLRREPRISAASTYTDRATAERVVARTLARHRGRIDQWLARQGPRPNLALEYRGDRNQPIGRSLTRRSARPDPCVDATVVLRWDGRRGFIVLTSYPEISR